MQEFVTNLTSPSWWISVVVVGLAINLASDYLKPAMEWVVSRIQKWLIKPTANRFKRFLANSVQRMADNIKKSRRESVERMIGVSSSKMRHFFEIAEAMRFQQRGILFQIEASFFLVAAAWTKYLWQQTPTIGRLIAFVLFALAASITLIAAIKETIKANTRWKEIEKSDAFMSGVVANLVKIVEENEEKERKSKEVYDVQ